MCGRMVELQKEVNLPACFGTLTPYLLVDWECLAHSGRFWVLESLFGMIERMLIADLDYVSFRKYILWRLTDLLPLNLSCA